MMKKISRFVDITFNVLGSILSTGAALLILSFGLDVFGITIGDAIHGLAVISIMVFMVYLIYITWKQTWEDMKEYKK